jgi:dTDP-4-amino-4,6-dideoxygalactose transaminase/thioester reductase-like protein/acyl-CoA-binding protein
MTSSKVQSQELNNNDNNDSNNTDDITTTTATSASTTTPCNTAKTTTSTYNNTSSLSNLFDTITSMVQNSSPPLPLSDETKLQLYGLYKRCTAGTTTSSTATAPSKWNIVAYRKYVAWEECNDFTLEESMIRYIELVSSLECDLGHECLLLLEEFKTEKELHNTQKNIFCNDDSNDDNNNTNHSETMTKTIAKKSTLSSIKSKKEILNSSISSTTASTTTKSASLFTKFTGIQPFTTRGQLDISSSDLLFALFKSMPLPLPIFNNVASNTSSMRTIIQLEEDISKSWKEENNNNDNDKDNSRKDHIIAGLSVRSLLDLYLTAKSYPNDSEVIIVPPISIEGLMDVVQYHGIKVIPIDIDGDGGQHSHPIIKVDIDKVKKAITTKTVGILIVHPFGLVCMSDEEMKELKGVVDAAMDDVNKKIELWEDCAECFTGGVGHGHGYSGSKYVDVQFFSFGMIKTATALGGGIAVIKQDDLVNNENNTDLALDQKEVAEKMKRLQHMNYKEQSQREYLIKICKALLLHLVSRNLILSGILIRFMDCFGIDYDRFVTSSIKGFPTKEIKSTTDRELVEQKKDRGRELIQRLRKRPCLALLSLLHRRIIKSKSTRKTIGSRITRCEKMEALLKEHCPSIHIPIGSDTSQHLFWLFPFLVNDPTAVCQYMKKRGFDVPRGTSQLGCVTSFLIDSKHASSCPNTERMMNNILYLPIASAAMTTSDMQKMSIALRDAIKYTSESSNKGCDENIEMKNNNGGKCNLRLQFTMVLVTLLIFDGSVSCMLPFSSTFFSLARTFVEIYIPWTLSSICVLLVIIHIVRSTIGSYYINCSNAYAKYNSIFHESSTNSPKSVLPTLNGTGLKIVNCSDSYKQSDDLFESKIFDLPNLKQSSANGSSDKLVLLTGGTGFIGSLLLRYLLFHRSQLCINGVVLICRSKRQLSAVQRVEKMMEKPMFSFLNDQEKKDLVIVINGDVASPNIGMTENDSQRLCQELNITHVFNCAACVNFTEPLENAAESNITSALQLQQFTKKLRNKHAIYIYLSTAFIHGCQNGTKDNPLAEELFDFGKYNPVELYESMMNTQSCASKAMHDLGFPNTYTFSKSICEHLLMNKKDLQTIIIRPSIVGPSIQEPFEGWAGDKPSTLVAGACLYMKNPYNLWTFRRETSPVIPVDVVCRFVLAKAFQKPLEMVPFTSKNDDDVSKSSEESCRSSELSYVFTKSSTMKSYLSETDSSQCLSDESVDRHQQIFTAAWDSKSNASSGFLWYDFACAIVQLSSANGHVELSLAYFVLLVSFKIFLAMNLTFVTFSKVHKILVHGPFHVVKYLCRMLGLNPKILKDFDKLGPFLDLPLLFFPFTTSTYYFDSDLVAPTSINGERYMFSCILAAEKFVMSINEKMLKGKDRKEKLHTKSSSSLLIAGGKHKRLSSDIWWALTQPKGSYTIRLIGLIISKILRHTTTEVTIDMTSLAQLARAIEESTDKTKPYLILAPTHRSFFDFILLSFLSFSVPEFGISTPHIAAADDFSRIPVLGWFAQMAGAFFLTRGKGIADPGLKSKVTALKDQHSMENPSCIEVFLEGKRSRDRRFLKPKTGFLR